MGGPVGEFKGWVQWGVHWVSPKGGYSGGGPTGRVQRKGTVGGGVHQESPKGRYGGGPLKVSP